jgi:inorganic pyrophosphatase
MPSSFLLKFLTACLFATTVMLIGCQSGLSDSASPADTAPVTILTNHDYLRGFEAYFDDELVHIVVEIPAGSNQKWEVEKDTGHLAWERISADSLRVVRYLPYPANYGMVPRTLLSLESGGDGDPLDIFLLGESHAVGSVVPGRIIGMVRMTDRGEGDDKLIAVDPSGWFSGIRNINQLESEFPGVLTILKTFLSHYKGAGFVEILRISDADKAMEIFKQSASDFENAQE